MSKYRFFKYGDRVVVDASKGERNTSVIGVQIHGVINRIYGDEVWVEWREDFPGVTGRGDWFNRDDLRHEGEDEEPVTESSQFDKFMDRILISEGRAVKKTETVDSPQRKIAKLYRESAANRTVFLRGGSR